MPLTQYTFKDGRTIEWSGEGISICTKCDDVFNSGAAFDHHLKTTRRGQPAVHDISGMPRNKKGYLVISLFDEDAFDKEGEDERPVICPTCGGDLMDEDLYQRTTCPYCGEDWDD